MKESIKNRKSRIVGNNNKFFAIRKNETLKSKKNKTIKEKELLRKSLMGRLLEFGNVLNYNKGCFGKCKYER